MDPRLHYTIKEKEEPTKHRHRLIGLLEKPKWAGEMAQRTKAAATNPDDLSSVPGIHKAVEGNF